MKTIGNVLWVLLGGIWISIGWLLWAVVLAATIVGIPLARQCVKLAHFSLWPVGRTIVKDPTATKLGWIGAVVWIFPGIVMAIGYVVAGAFLCLTVIGIPFGIQSIKLAGLALQPFGKKVIRSKDMASFYVGVASKA